MSDFPKSVEVPRLIVHPFMQNSIGFNQAIVPYPTGTTAWPSANAAIYIPFVIGASTTIVKFFWLNGATVSGNIDVGIYDSQGNRLVSSGSTVQTTINVIQSVDTTDLTLQPGLYYMAMAMDNTSGVIRASAGTAILNRASGIYSQASAFPLPSSATFAGTTLNIVPALFLTARVLV